jgi:hypothetical protein
VCAFTCLFTVSVPLFLGTYSLFVVCTFKDRDSYLDLTSGSAPALYGCLWLFLLSMDEFCYIGFVHKA